MMSMLNSPVSHKGDTTNYELSNKLAEFTRRGVPPLQGFNIAEIRDEAFACLLWIKRWHDPKDIYGDNISLSPNDESRQAVIRELVFTEADYIRHLIAIVEVFIAAAHALQDDGKLLVLDTERLFINIPDILNANLHFWEITFYPMLMDSLENKTPLNADHMSVGFYRFREIFQPYEKYVGEQSRALDYLRSLSTNPDVMLYLAWCHTHQSCNRLQLPDILAKPMQRLTKYSLLLRRLISYTNMEPERTNLIAMDTFAKNYVLDINRSIRQREELDKLEALSNSIECFEIDFRDDELDRAFRLYSGVNLKAPMVNCNPNISRTLIHEGDLRFKDNVKEMEVKVFLLTDMLLICKKLSKGSPYPYKLIRPKYMINKLNLVPKSKGDDNSSLVFVVVDDIGSSWTAFAISDTSKDPSQSIKQWEQKFREAKYTYELFVWYSRNPVRDITEIEMDISSEYNNDKSNKQVSKLNSEEAAIERDARERVAVMMHRTLTISTDHDYSLGSAITDSIDVSGDSIPNLGRPQMNNSRHNMKRTSTGGSSRNSRYSSFHQSLSATSHDEPQNGPNATIYKPGLSVEHHIPPLHSDDGGTSITVNVVSESESETFVSQPTTIPLSVPPVVVSRPTSPCLPSRSSSSSRYTLGVQPHCGVMALVHSLPDLTLDPLPKITQRTTSQSASEKLYQSHNELLNRKQYTIKHQYLRPDQRGTSYPPPSPTRASLKRGLAFSYSTKNPPLSKMGHVNSQSQIQTDTGPSAVNKGDKTISSFSDTKIEKKGKHISSRNKDDGSSSLSRSKDIREDQQEPGSRD